MRGRRALLRHMALLLIVAAVLAHQTSLPVLQGSDEAVHFNYITRLMAGEGLPDRAAYLTNEARQASGQPPLAYLFYALWGRILRLEPIDGSQVLDHLREEIHNPWYQPHQVWNRIDNVSYLIHGDDDARGIREAAFGWPELVQQDRLLRLASLLWVMAAALGAYSAAREVFHGEEWALTAALLFGLMPTMLYVSSYVTNDTAATALSAWVTWGALRIIRRGASNRLLIAVGVLLALGGLAKINVLLLAPALVVTVWWSASVRSGAWRTRIAALVTHSLLVFVPVALLMGPWLVWGLLHYGDPLGLSTHRHNMTVAYSANLLPLSEVLSQFPHTYLSYLGWFDTVAFSPMTYTAIGGTVLIAAVGLGFSVLRLRSWTRTHQGQALVLLTIFLFVLFGMVRWMQQLSFTGGRLMYPAHAAISLAMTAGLYALWRRWPRFGRAAQVSSVVVVAVSGAVLGPLAIRSAFAAPPRLSEDALPALTGTPTDYSEPDSGAPFLRLLGTAFPSGDRINGETLPLTSAGRRWRGPPANRPSRPS